MEDLKAIVGDKDYFVVTSNGECHFELCGFAPEKIYEGFISYFRYTLDICKSYDNGDIALFFYFDVRQLTHCVRYIGVSFGVKKYDLC